MFCHVTFIILAYSAVTLGQTDEERYFDSNGVKIRFIVEGTGEPVILVHGFTSSIDKEWRRTGVISKLSESFQVIALDTRGHGKSDKPISPQEYGAEMARDVLRLMDHLSLERAHIVGYSLGGFTTEYLVANHPERWVSATIGGMGWMQADDPRLALTGTLAVWLENGKEIDQFLTSLRPKSNKETPANPAVFGVLRGDNLDALAACARAIPKLAVTREQLQANKVPTLAVIGGNDALKASVADMKEVMSNLKVEVIPGTDHESTLRAPSFVEEIRSFLEAHSHHSADASK